MLCFLIEQILIYFYAYLTLFKCFSMWLYISFSFRLYPTLFYYILIFVNVWFVILYNMNSTSFLLCRDPSLSLDLSMSSNLGFKQFNSNSVLRYYVTMSISIVDLNVLASNPILFYVTLIKFHVNCFNAHYFFDVVSICSKPTFGCIWLNAMLFQPCSATV